MSLNIEVNGVGRKIKDDLREIALEVIGQKIATGDTLQNVKTILQERILKS